MSPPNVVDPFLLRLLLEKVMAALVLGLLDLAIVDLPLLSHAPPTNAFDVASLMRRIKILGQMKRGGVVSVGQLLG